MEMSIFKIGIIFYLLASVVVSYLLWTNSGAENVSTQLITLSGAILVAFIAVVPSLRAEERHAFLKIVLFKNTETNSYVIGFGDEPYWSALGGVWGFAQAQVGPSGSPEAIFENADEADLVQRALLDALTDMYAAGWDAEIIETVSVGSFNRGHISVPTDSPSETLNSSTIIAAMRRNKYINAENAHRDVKVPPGTTLEELRGDSYGRALRFSNNEFQIAVEINGKESRRPISNVVGLISTNVGTQYEMTQYNVVIQGKTLANFRRHPENIKGYWKWYENSLRGLTKLDWSTIETDLKDQERQGMLRIKRTPHIH